MNAACRGSGGDVFRPAFGDDATPGGVGPAYGPWTQGFERWPAARWRPGVDQHCCWVNDAVGGKLHIRARAYTSYESRQCRYMPLHAQRIDDRAAMPQVDCAKRQCRNMYARQCRNPSRMCAALPHFRCALRLKRQCRERIVTNCIAVLSGIATQAYTHT